MSLILSAELAAACNALGHYDPTNKVYFNEDNLVETVKDIIRYLRRDTGDHEIRRYFGTAKILQINLVPLLKLYWEQTDLFDVLLRLLGNLTSPVLLLFGDELPKDKSDRNHFLQILGHLQSYKEAFGDDELWAVLCTRLSQLLNIEWQERGTENGLIIERILILVRNVLSVPADLDDEKRADNDVSAHDKVLWSLRQSDLVDIIHYMVSSDQEEAYSMYLLEILTLMLREHRPIDLAQASGERTETEKTLDDNEFTKIRVRELSRRKERLKNYTSARHSRFGGSYILENIKSVNDTQQLIYHKKLNTASAIDFDVDKFTSRVAKNKKPVRETNSHRRSTFSIRLLLKDFCIEFLNSGYNKLMHIVRGKLVRGQSMENDETYYLWALRFFMEFNRHYKFNVKFISETLGHEIFYYIQQRMEHYYDMIFSDKKNLPLWSKRLHTAVQAYKELLLNIATMDKSTDSTIKQHAKIIKNNIFYIVEYREFVLQLLVAYDQGKMSDAYLIDVIETQHIFLKMLQAYCGQDNAIVVQKIQKVKKKKRQTTAAAPVVSVEEALEIKWDELGPQLSTVLEGGENIPIVAPFDAASEVPINDQRKDAMIKIQDHLREGEFENAIGLLRSARDVWPDNDSFGSSSMTPEEEFLAIREIFFAKLRDKELPAKPATEQEEDEEDEEDDEERTEEVEKEVDLKFQDFVNRFAQPKVIQACGLALRQFDTNSVHVNHCILKLLHRIAWDCKMPTMLFQASIFRTFQRIFAEAARPEFKELLKFAIYIIRQFVKVTEKNKKVFMELLFWKNSKDAFDIEEGYGTYETKSRSIKNVWSEEEENELRVLVMEFREKEIEEDSVDWIMNNLVDNTKTRRQIIKKLKELMLMDKGSNKKTSLSRPPKDWEEEEIAQLTELYNQFQDAMDPLSCIMDRLDVKRPKARVKQKILELGLADNKALRKKRTTQSAGHHEEENFPSRSIIDDDNSDSSSDDENENRSKTKANPRPKARNPDKKPKLTNNKKAVKNLKLELPAVKKLLLEIIEKDMIDSLKWISECLTETAEDQEQDINLDGNEGIPLVPINAKDMQAIKNPLFEKFLLGIGIQQPASEQERFWRIPGNVLAAELTKQANFIDELVEKGAEAFPEFNERRPVATAEQPAEESSDEDVFDRLRNFISKPYNEEPYYTEAENENVNEQHENNEENVFIEYDLVNGVIIQNSQSSSPKNIPSKEFNVSAKISNRNATMDDSDVSSSKNIDDLNKSKSRTKKKGKYVTSDLDHSDSEIGQQNEPDNNIADFSENKNLTKSISKMKSKIIKPLDDSDESDTENVENKETLDESDISSSENGNDLNESKTRTKKKGKIISISIDSDQSDSEIVEDPDNKIVKDSRENKNFTKSISKKISKIIRPLDDSDESDSENVENKETIDDSDVSSSENVNDHNESKSRTKKKGKIMSTYIDSDQSDSEIVKKLDNNIAKDSSENKNKTFDENEEKSKYLLKKTYITKALEDSEDSDTNIALSEDAESVSKRTRESDSESHNHRIKRKKLAIIDSDED